MDTVGDEQDDKFVVPKLEKQNNLALRHQNLIKELLGRAFQEAEERGLVELKDTLILLDASLKDDATAHETALHTLEDEILYLREMCVSQQCMLQNNLEYTQDLEKRLRNGE